MHDGRHLAKSAAGFGLGSILNIPPKKPQHSQKELDWKVQAAVVFLQ